MCPFLNTDTEIPAIEEAFKRLTDRSDVAILLINQHVSPTFLIESVRFAQRSHGCSTQIANEIRHVLRDYNKIIPTVLEIPSKDQPYDPEQVSPHASRAWKLLFYWWEFYSQDYIMQRVNIMLGGQS